MAVDRSDVARVFERAPGLVEELSAEAPFATAEAFLTRARTLLDAMNVVDRIAVLNAHPRIGADPASLSADSRREQAARDDRDAGPELAQLNDEYERRFGFRFVVFVAGRPRSQIVPVLRERLRRTRHEELATAVDEVMRIARDRMTEK